MSDGLGTLTMSFVPKSFKHKWPRKFSEHRKPYAGPCLHSITVSPFDMEWEVLEEWLKATESSWRVEVTGRPLYDSDTDSDCLQYKLSFNRESDLVLYKMTF